MDVWRQKTSDSPGIKLNLVSLDMVNVWVTLTDLDLQFWSEQMLSRIVSTIGKPKHTDKITGQIGQRTEEGRLSYARVLVEMEARKPLKSKITLRGPKGEEQE